MALRAIDVGTRVAPVDLATDLAPRPATVPAPSLATVHELRPLPRVVTLGAQRRERRRWFVLGALLLAAPFAGCLGVLGVVR
jgi:hypothetical protein